MGVSVLTTSNRVAIVTRNGSHFRLDSGASMNQLTIRGFDAELATYIQDLARREGISLNRAVMRLLRRGAELDEGKADVVGSSLDHLMGTWSAEEADRIDQALEDFSGIEEAMWK